MNYDYPVTLNSKSRFTLCNSKPPHAHTKWNTVIDTTILSLVHGIVPWKLHHGIKFSMLHELTFAHPGWRSLSTFMNWHFMGMEASPPHEKYSMGLEKSFNTPRIVGLEVSLSLSGGWSGKSEEHMAKELTAMQSPTQSLPGPLWLYGHEELKIGDLDSLASITSCLGDNYPWYSKSGPMKTRPTGVADTPLPIYTHGSRINVSTSVTCETTSPPLLFLLASC